MSEPWKGPWKCDSCGMVTTEWCKEHWLSVSHDGITHPTMPCMGKLKPYDRRAPSPTLAALVEAADGCMRWLREALQCGLAADGAMQTDWRIQIKKTRVALEAARKEGAK